MSFSFGREAMNRAQKQQLRLYAHFRDRKMSVPALFCFNWRLYAFLIVAGGLSVTAMVYLQQWLYAWAFGLCCLIVLLRDAGGFRRSSRTWPLIQEVLNWSKVDLKARSE